MTSPLRYWISQSSFVFTIYRFIGFVTAVRFRFLFYSKQKSQKTKRSNLLLSFLFYSNYFDHFSRIRKYLFLGNTFRNMICVTNFHFVPSFVLIFSLDIWPSSASSNWSGAEWEHLKMFGCCHSLWMRGQITNSGQGMRLPGQWSEARKFLWFHSASREHIPLLS